MAGLFSSPLADALILANIGSNLGQSVKASQASAMQPDPTSLTFANAAYQSGNLVDEVPRQANLFSNLGVKMGLLSPNVKPRPKDIAEELSAISSRHKEQLEELGKEVDLRTKLGWNDFQELESTPAMRDITMFATGGRPWIDLSGPTPKEQAIQEVSAQRKFQRDQANIRNRIAVDELQIKADLTAQNLRIPKFGSEAWFAAQKRTAGERRAAAEAATDDYIMGNWTAFDRHFPNVQFRDAESGAQIDRKHFDTPAKALADRVNVVRVSGAQAIQLANGMQANIADLLNLRNNVLPRIFINSAGMTRTNKDGHLIMNWLKSKAFYSDPDVVSLGTITSDAIAYGKQIQGRSVNSWEAKQIVKANFPNLWTDDLAMAQTKLDKVIKHLQIAGGFAMRDTAAKDVLDSASSDAARDLGPSEAEMGADTSGVLTGPSSVPAEPSFPPGSDAAEMYGKYFGGEDAD